MVLANIEERFEEAQDKEQWEKYKKDKAVISESEINNKIELRNKARLDKNELEAKR